MLKRLLIVGLFGIAVWGQQPTRTVTLTWDDLVNPAGTVYNVYRAKGSCLTAPSFLQIKAGVAVKTYDDMGVSPGNYCYAVKAILEGMESDFSNMAAAAVKPFPPSNVGATVQ